MSRSLTEFLVYGYIRENERDLLKQIIPDSIVQIFVYFYCHNQYLKLITSDCKSYKNELYMVNINDESSKHKFDIYRLHNNKLTKMESKESIVQWAGICGDNNMNLPHEIHQEICAATENNSLVNDYNATFKCCGNKNEYSNYCSVTLINNTQMSANIAYHWTLPSYPASIDCNSLVYSKQRRTLYNIGGYDYKPIHSLKFGKNCSKFKWEKLAELDTIRGIAAVCLIDDESKIMIIGGYGQGKFESSVVAYDIEKKNFEKIAPIREGVFGSGVFYDEYNELVYHGGGEYSQRYTSKRSEVVECLDLGKNKWTSLVKTKYRHKHSPVLWMSQQNELCIASVGVDHIEAIDVRENKAWKIKQNVMDYVGIHT